MSQAIAEERIVLCGLFYVDVVPWIERFIRFRGLALLAYGDSIVYLWVVDWIEFSVLVPSTIKIWFFNVES